jgi:hypothetical protein
MEDLWHDGLAYFTHIAAQADVETDYYGNTRSVDLAHILICLAFDLAVNYGYREAGGALQGVATYIENGPEWLRDGHITRDDAIRIREEAGPMRSLRDDHRQIELEFPS